MGPFFPKEFFFFGGALGLGPTCLGLEPAVWRTDKWAKTKKIDSLTKQKEKAKQEKKTIYSDGKKLKEKWDVAANAEEEKKEAERIKREIEEKWSDYNEQFENLTCNGG